MQTELQGMRMVRVMRAPLCGVCCAGGQIDWGYLKAGDKQFGGGGRQYDMLGDEVLAMPAPPPPPAAAVQNGSHDARGAPPEPAGACMLQWRLGVPCCRVQGGIHRHRFFDAEAGCNVLQARPRLGAWRRRWRSWRSTGRPRRTRTKRPRRRGRTRRRRSGRRSKGRRRGKTLTRLAVRGAEGGTSADQLWMGACSCQMCCTWHRPVGQVLTREYDPDEASSAARTARMTQGVEQAHAGPTGVTPQARRRCLESMQRPE